jgi:hypothetical protein
VIPEFLELAGQSNYVAAASDIPRSTRLPVEEAHSWVLYWPVSIRRLLVATAVSSSEAKEAAEDAGE